MPKRSKLPNAIGPPRRASRFVFISYRRADSSAASRWLYDAIQRTFGPDSVFMDTEAIRVSAEWPKAIQQGLQKATHLIAVIGSQWLRVTDDYGRRRIDRDDDWVRAEIAHALQHAQADFANRPCSRWHAPGGGATGGDREARVRAAVRVEKRPMGIRPEPAGARIENQGFERSDDERSSLSHATVSITEIPQKEFASILRTLPGWNEVVSPLPGYEPCNRSNFTSPLNSPRFSGPSNLWPK